jgi:hypothetical protein
MNPEILTHPNIPKPLHGLNPRSILGKEWWDKTRFEAQRRTNYTCSACGVKKSEAKKHQWLEGHEYFDINYKTGVCEVKSIEPLCHYCHNFIHSGRLSIIINNEKTIKEVIDILEHGFKILSDNNLESFYFTLELAEKLGAKTFGVSSYELDFNNNLEWSDFKLLLNGKVYDSLYKNQLDWYHNYNK